MGDLGSPSSEGLSDGFMETSLVGETMLTEDGKVKKHDDGKSFVMIVVVDSSNGMFSKFPFYLSSIIYICTFILIDSSPKPKVWTSPLPKPDLDPSLYGEKNIHELAE